MSIKQLLSTPVSSVEFTEKKKQRNPPQPISFSALSSVTLFFFMGRVGLAVLENKE